MDDQPDTGVNWPNPPFYSGLDGTEMFLSMAEIGQRSQKILSEFISRQAHEGLETTADPFNITNAFMEMTVGMMTDPFKQVEHQISYWRDYVALLQGSAARLMGSDAPAVIEPDKGDRRFKDESWVDYEIFNFIKQSYLLTAQWVLSSVHGVEGLEKTSAKKVDFFTRQFLNAMSPSNFALTNPEVIRATYETGGENLLNGLKNMLGDLEKGKGRLAVTMTDESAFDVGRNVASSPGKVIFRNDLIELLQFDPSTETVCRRPLLIVTPWINKYYILDLRKENSFIKWAVDQGHTVFVTSWINPDERHAGKTFSDYMLEGPLAALDAIEAATGEREINAIGYCIGGTLLASTLAYMAKKNDDRIVSATYLTTMVDFEEPGELGIFIDEEQLDALEKRMNERGYLEGSEMAGSFYMMRDNDLIWSFVINNYLLGKDPFPFDLLYWNSDTTRMPAAMHGFYLRKMYLENKLVEPGGITLDGVPIDLRKIKTPSYILSTRDDHIAPWESTFAATGLYSGPVTFVLSASGHIAGVVNPPARDKYCYWTNGKKPKAPDQWLETAAQQDGSWWPHWNKWVKRHAGGTKTPARIPGKGDLKALCDAPGTYVKMR